MADRPLFIENPRGEVPPPVQPCGQGPAAAIHAAGPDWLECIALAARAHAKRLDDATALFAAFDDFDLVSAFDNAAGRGVGSVADRVSLSIEAHLARAFARKAAA